MTTAIVNATLIDGTGAGPVERATVVIEGDRIEKVGPGIEPPRDAEVIDAHGSTLMPGMIDSHVHFLSWPASMQESVLTAPSLRLFRGARNALDTLDAGITSVRDASGTPQGFKAALDRGLIHGPRTKISVSALSESGGHGDSTMPSGNRIQRYAGPEYPETVVDGPHEVLKAVRQLLRAGADFIKLCSTGGVLSPADEPGHTQFTPEEIAVMVHEAAAHGKTCMAHAQGNQGVKNAVYAGVESIEHGIWLDDEVIAAMKERNTFLVPTLVAPIWVLRREERNPGSVLPMAVRKTQEVIGVHQASFRQAVESGVRIAMGTDSGVGEHGSNAEELAVMVANGMTPMQAIVAKTKTASECIHAQNDVGTLEPGKLADLLLVDGSPLDDIAVLQDRARLLLIMQGSYVHKNLLGSSRPAAISIK
jgi:imidazolonepropionase-like amidohydrolase